MSQIQIRDSNGQAIPLIHYTVSRSENPDDPYIDDFFVDFAGNSSWPRIGIPSDNIFLHVNYFNKQTSYEYQKVPVNGTNDVKIVLAKIPIVIPPLQSVRIDGDNFRTEDNNIFRICGGSNFMLPQLVAEGVDITSLLYSGLNTYRIFGTYHYIAQQVGLKDWHPSQYPNYLQAIDKCFDVLFANYKYAELNLICDNQIFGLNVSQLTNLQNQVCEILRSKKNAFYSLGNENEANGFNADNFDKPSGLICACGSGLTGGPAPLSRGKVWDLSHQHLRRDEKMFIDIPPVDYPWYFMEHKLVFDETIGFADFNDPGKRTNNTDWAYKLGRVMSAWNGGYIHLHSGGHSQPLVGQENVCKDEFVRAFNDR